MVNHKHKFFLSIFAFVFCFSLLCFYVHEQYQAAKIVNPASTSGTSLPNFTFYDKKGHAKELEQVKGKAVLVSFWASWCAPCLIELPDFQKLYEKYSSDGLEILAINLDDNGDEAYPFVKRFWESKNIAFPTYYDFSKASADKLMVSRLPTNFLLNADHEIVFESQGLQDWKSERIQKMIEDVLN
tara:strand:+ start:4517 stop:5071 length:555 start_codon:yes stop_codon:yes gene_type:complete